MVVGAMGARFLRDRPYLPPAVLIVTEMMTRGLLVCSPSVTSVRFWMIVVLSLRSVASVTFLFCHLVLTTDQPRRCSVLLLLHRLRVSMRMPPMVLRLLVSPPSNATFPSLTFLQRTRSRRLLATTRSSIDFNPASPAQQVALMGARQRAAMALSRLLPVRRTLLSVLLRLARRSAVLHQRHLPD